MSRITQDDLVTEAILLELAELQWPGIGENAARRLASGVNQRLEKPNDLSEQIIARHTKRGIDV